MLPGEKLVTISKSGYATISKTKEVIGGEASTLDVALDPPGTINGKVTDSDSGDPIVGATILYDGGSTTTNGSGNYTIAGIPAGNQALIASADGYESSPAQDCQCTGQQQRDRQYRTDAQAKLYCRRSPR